MTPKEPSRHDTDHGAGRARGRRAVSSARGSVRVERGAKRIRAFLGGELVADTISPLMVWEAPYYPTYYFPEADVLGELVDEGAPPAHSPSRGEGQTLSIRAGGQLAQAAVTRYESSPIPELARTVRIAWAAMDSWFEEDEEVYTHARDPYTRIDILASSRHVRILLDGIVLADSTSSQMLFETGLPTRYYLAKTHTRMDLLALSETVTHCPYKGRAQTWSIRLGGVLHEDLAWSYPTPLPESQKIAGLISFFNEKLDIEIDGIPQQRPTTKFS